jgi:hemoglobin/transferrin/lactoferrin receptor protein
MLRQSTIAILGALLILTCWLPALALADSNESDSLSDADQVATSTTDKSGFDDVVDLDKTIIVSAKRRAAPLLETPHAVSVIDQDAIRQSGSFTTGQLLKGKPGLACHSDGAWGANPTIRGLKKEQIVIMIDGVRINSAQPWGALASMLDPSLFERVEAVRGPASMLYGSGGMGGVVNLISRQHRFSEELRFSGQLTSTGSSVSDGYTGAGSFVLTSSRHIVEVSSYGGRFKDYQAPDGEVPRTAYDQWGWNARYKLNLGKSHTLGVAVQNHKVEDVWYPGSARPHPAPPVGVSTIHSPSQERTQYRFDYQVLFSGSRLEMSIYRQEVERTMYAFSESLQKDFVRNEVPFTTNGGSAKFDFFALKDHCVSVGLDLWRSDGDPERWLYQPPPSNNLLHFYPFTDGQVSSVGTFVQDDISLGRWKVKLGARFDRVKGEAGQVGYGPAARTEGLDHTDNSFSWTTGAVYNNNEQFNPYVNVARGYRAADLRERFENVVRGDGFVHIGDPGLDPEVNTTVEVGARGKIGAFGYSLSAYNSWIKDFIAGRETGMQDPNTGLFTKQTENLAEVEIRGIEFELDYLIAADIHAHTCGSYQRGENKFDDEPLYQVPPVDITLGMAYRPELGFNGNTHWRLVAEQDRVAEQFSGGSENATPGFSTVDARVGYRFSELYELHLGVLNLFDEEYHEHLTEGVSDEEIKAPGRSIYVGTTIGF